MKSNGLYTTSALTKIALTLSLALTPAAVLALPQQEQVVSGVAAIAQSQARTDIHQQSNKAILNWKSFDVSRGETVQFHQPSAQSVTLNRVTGSQHPSQIHGNLSANGQVILVNPNGMHFGRTAVVDVNGLIASTANISNNDFLAGKLHFNEAGNPNAAIINEGAITVKQGGLAAMVAPSVENSGIIVAQQGTVALAAGETATFDFYGDKLINFAVAGKTTSGINNTGKLAADGGAVYLTASQARTVVDNVINTSGVIEASSARVEGGEIVLDGGNGGVKVAGSIKATGSKGGKVRVKTTGDVLVDSGTVIDASGETAGGSIVLGGNALIGETLIAKTVDILAGSSLIADATQSGTGGDIIIWSTDASRFNGSISARGDEGGFAEVSSTGLLGFYGQVDLSGRSGVNGTLLLDPTIINIKNGNPNNNGRLNDNVINANATSPSGDVFAIAPSAILAALARGNVQMSATQEINLIDTLVQTVTGHENNVLTLKAPTITFDAVVNLLSKLTIDATTFTANQALTTNTLKANATTFKIGDSFTGTIDSTSTFPHIVVLDNDASLDFWLDELNDGGKFDIAAGTYTQTLTLTNKSALISGDEEGGTIFELFLPSADAILLQGQVDGTSISDLSIKMGDAFTGSSQYAAIKLVGEGQTVENVTLDDVHTSYSASGLELVWGIFDGLTLNDSSFSNHYSYGVYVAGALTDSTITNTQFYNSNYGIFNAGAMNNVTIQSIDDGKSSFSGGSYAFYNASAATTIGDQTITTGDLTFDGVEFKEIFTGIEIQSFDSNEKDMGALTIKNSLFENLTYAINMYFGEDNTLSTFDLSGNRFVNNYSHFNFWKSDNSYSGLDMGIKLANGSVLRLKEDWQDKSQRVQADFNTAFADITERNSFDRKVYVSDTPAGSNWIGSAVLYGSIGGAINNSGANLTNWIAVGAGTYDESLFITRSVNIAGLGDDASDVKIAPEFGLGGGKRFLGAPETSVVTIQAPAVTMQNLTIDGSGVEYERGKGEQVTPSLTGILISGGNVTLDNIHVTNFDDENFDNTGIKIQYGNQGNCMFMMCGIGRSEVSLRDGPYQQVFRASDVTISNSVIDNVSDVGIFLSGDLPSGSVGGGDFGDFINVAVNFEDSAIIEENPEFEPEPLPELIVEPNSLTIIDTAIADADAGLQVTGANAQVAFNDNAGSSFTGNERFAIELLNGALDNQVIEVGSVSFNGTKGSNVIAAIGEALVHDQDDLDTVGDIQFTALAGGGGGAGGGAGGGVTPPTTNPTQPSTPTPPQPDSPSATPNVPPVVVPTVTAGLLTDALQNTNIDSDSLVPFVQNLLNQGYSFDDVVAGLSLLSNSQLSSLTTNDLGSLEPAAGGNSSGGANSGSTENQESSCVNSFLDTGFMASFSLQECNS